MKFDQNKKNRILEKTRIFGKIPDFENFEKIRIFNPGIKFPEIIKSIFRGSHNDKGVVGSLSPSGGTSWVALRYDTI